MTDPDTLSDECAPGANNGNHQFAPCSCCMALAQARMVSMPSIDQSGQADGFSGGNGNGKQAKQKKGLSFRMPGIYAQKREESNAAESHSESVNKSANDAQESKEKSTEESTKAASDEWQDDLGLPKNRKLWQGLEGKAVMILGVVVPIIMLGDGCMSAPKRITLLLLNHPLYRHKLYHWLLLARLPGPRLSSRRRPPSQPHAPGQALQCCACSGCCLQSLRSFPVNIRLSWGRIQTMEHSCCSDEGSLH